MELNPQQWLRVKETVASALELAPGMRDAFVHDACLGDAMLIEEALSLLSFEDPQRAPVPPKGALTPGATVSGRYVIERELGLGGFATTYIAQDRQLLNRRVVVKVLTSTETDPYIQRKFHEELQALSSLEHPNIVAPLDSGLLPGGAPFIIMQFAEGKTLRALLVEGRIPLLRAGLILTQLARTLAFIHSKGIYHRDLKPENIIVQTYDNFSDHVRLIDFGIASIVDQGSSVNTRIVGSLSYMAPEQFTGHVNPQTDIYAFGVVAYEVITGVLPFRASSHIELMQAQREDTIISPRQLHPQLNPHVERLILEALTFSPHNRPTNTATFADQLANVTWTAPSPQPTPSQPKLSRWLWLLLVMPITIIATLARPHAALLKPTTPQRAALPPAISQTLVVELTKRSSTVPIQMDVQGLGHLEPHEDFRVVLQSSIKAHAYIFSLGAHSRKLHILFPSPTTYHGQSTLQPGQPLSIPEKTWFRFDVQPDVETIFIVWSTSPKPDLEDAIRWASPRDRGVVPHSQSSADLLQLLQGSPNALKLHNTQWQMMIDHDSASGWIQIAHS